MVPVHKNCVHTEKKIKQLTGAQRDARKIGEGAAKKRTGGKTNRQDTWRGKNRSARGKRRVQDLGDLHRITGNGSWLQANEACTEHRAHRANDANDKISMVPMGLRQSGENIQSQILRFRKFALHMPWVSRGQYHIFPYYIFPCTVSKKAQK